MKRVLMLLLALVMLLSMFGCGGGGEAETTTQVPPVLTDVASPLTQAQIDAIPFATADMTVDELRQICVDFMRLQVTFGWTPSKDFPFILRENEISMTGGKVYGGMMYLYRGKGNIYNLLPYYNQENGMLDMDGVMQYANWEHLFGNQCGSAAWWAWSRVCNSFTWGLIQEMVPNNGCLPVGPYKVPSISMYDSVNTTVAIAKNNGEQVMFESYACVLPADGMIGWNTSPGHTEMVSAKPVVVRNPDGTIDGEKSYVTFLDQNSQWTDGIQSNGKPITYQTFQAGTDHSFSFKRLYDAGYLPFTIPEFVGKSTVEAPTVSASVTTATVTAFNLAGMKIKSNYSVSYAVVEVKNKAGKVLYTQNVYSNKFTNYELSLSASVKLSVLKDLANGKNTVEVKVMTGYGKLQTAYSGKLAKS